MKMIAVFVLGQMIGFPIEHKTGVTDSARNPARIRTKIPLPFDIIFNRFISQHHILQIAFFVGDN